MAEGLTASSIRNALLPLRAIYRHALALDEVAVNPTTGVQLPAVRGRPERIASPGEAARLIAALPKQDRALWATAIYAGLRSGELQALADDMVDLDKNIIRVHWGWDPKAGRVAPRVAPAAAPSRSPPRCGCTWSSSSWLAAVAAGFSSVAGAATRSRIRRSASAPSAPGGPGLEPIGLHDCLHTFASLMIAAGVKREGPVGLHGACVDHDDPRPVRASVTGL